MGISLETLLHTEMANEFDKLEGMEVGSDKYIKTVDGLTKLMDRAIKIDELNEVHERELESREFEKSLKLKEFEEEKRDRLIKNCLTGAGIGLPLLFYGWGVLKSLKFEETGTVTSLMGRATFLNLIPKIKFK